jgi:phenylalanyl-tRNA synthetase alpha chain
MSEITLKPVHLRILKMIASKGSVHVPELTNMLDIDRGTIEGGIATLVQHNLIRREVNNFTIHKLTERGIKANNGLIERLLIKSLSTPQHMKDLQSLDGYSKGDISAGIGILKKSGLITIDKGVVSLKDIKAANAFSKDLENALELLTGGKTSIEDKIAQKLKDRGFVNFIEKSDVIVSSDISKKKLDSIKSVEEVSRLTPEMLVSGSWRDVSFKPYSMDAKPRKVHAGKLHPYRQFLDHLKSKLVGLGFEEMKGPIIEQEFWNFDALYAPQDHPSREDSDILLIKKPTHGKLVDKEYTKNVARTHEDGWTTGSKGLNYKWDPRKAARLLMRPQGTSMSARTLSTLTSPAKYFSIGKCFRPDQVDRTHSIEFEQTEGIIVGSKITFRDLLGMLKTFATEVAGVTDIRFRPDYYPFTSPSVELSAKHPVLGYIEYGGAGLFRPEVTKPFGIDEPVLAWGLGVGRLFMTKYEIDDIRELFSQNIDYLRNEKVTSGLNPDKRSD